MGSVGPLNEGLLTEQERRNGHSKVSNISSDEELDRKGSRDEIILEMLGCENDSRSLITAEIKKATQLAWPLILFNVVVFTVPVTTLMFVGHLGELELSAASIASSFAMVSAYTVMIGFASTLETLCGQAFGAKNYRMLGIHLQSSWIVCTIVAFLILACWMNVASVLTAMGQDPEIASLAERYLMFQIPGVFGSGILRPMVKFLQSQTVVRPVLWCALVAFAVHFLACYLCIHTFGFGFIGGAIANCFTYQFLTVLVAMYIWISGDFKETFTGFTWEAFGSVGEYLKLAIPSTAMLCLEYWTAEILVLASGLLPNPQLQLSLLSISLSTTNLTAMIPNGLGGAAGSGFSLSLFRSFIIIDFLKRPNSKDCFLYAQFGTRVSNELGAYRPKAAKLAGKVIMGMALLASCIIASSILLARNVWGRAFSDVDEILEGVRYMTPLIALSALMDSVQGVLSGIARGCGRQDMGSYINLTAFYIVGIPAGLHLGFGLRMGAPGLWSGLLLGELTQTFLLTLLVVRTNWDKMVRAYKLDHVDFRFLYQRCPLDRADDAQRRVVFQHSLKNSSGH